jgi:hypothetical protein
MSRRQRAKRRLTKRAADFDITGAEKKLRQARFFLGYLEAASAVPLRRPGQEKETEPLEFHFSACLSAAQSVHYVLEEGGATFQSAKRKWLDGLKAEDRASFKQMIGLRGEDVHFAVTGAEPLPKYVSEDRARDWSGSPYYQRAAHNAALFGEAPMIEEKNPDGKTVTGSVLSAAIGLYVEQQGRRVEATDACGLFIEQLASLVETIKALPAKGTEAGAGERNLEEPGK